MTNQVANFHHFIYEVNDENLPTRGGQRIGTSATEIELLDDVPLTFTNTSKSPATTTRPDPTATKGQFEHPPTKVAYESPGDTGLGSAVDRLLQRYAPE